MSTISASTTTTTGFKVTSDTTGTLVLQTGATPTTAMTIDGSQNVGVGVTPSAWGSNYKVIQTPAGTLSNYTTIAVGLHQNSYDSAAGSFKYVTSNYATRYNQEAGVHSWYNAPSGTAGNAITFTQAMTLDASGNLLVGTTSSGQPDANFAQFRNIGGPSGVNCVSVGHITSTGSGTQYAYFVYGGLGIGSITQNGTTGVLYNITSDYRLKNNQEDLTGAKDFIMALKPKKWQWWDGSGEGVGFIAHEFMEVAKYSGHGEKDAVDEDGKPVYQSIQSSSSEVMANLVAHIQNLEARLAALENK